MLILGEFVCFAAFLIGQRIYLGVVPTASITNGTVLRSVILAACTWRCCPLRLRPRPHTSTERRAISVFVSVLLIVPIIGLFFPQNWQNDFTRFEPSTLGVDAVTFARQTLRAWSATLILLAYVLGTMAVALVLFQRRDAGSNQ